MNYSKENIQMRDVFIKILYNKAKKNKDLILISNEQGAESLDRFRKDLPNQFINAGISEQNIISVAAGLSAAKKKVYVYSISSFITLRCFEQIKINLSIMNLPVKILGVGASYSYDTAGPTHHSIDDISLFRTLKNFKIFSPSDNESLISLVNSDYNAKNPSYFRLDRKIVPSLKKKIDTSKSFRLFKANSKMCIISTGLCLNNLKKMWDNKKNSSEKFDLIDFFELKNNNPNKIAKILKNYKLVFTVEEHTYNGGIGSIISEIKADFNHGYMLKRYAIQDKYLYNYFNREKSWILNKIDNHSIGKILKKYL
jgi:transketolase